MNDDYIKWLKFHQVMPISGLISFLYHIVPLGKEHKKYIENCTKDILQQRRNLNLFFFN